MVGRLQVQVCSPSPASRPRSPLLGVSHHSDCISPQTHPLTQACARIRTQACNESLTEPNFIVVVNPTGLDVIFPRVAPCMNGDRRESRGERSEHGR